MASKAIGAKSLWCQEILAPKALAANSLWRHRVSVLHTWAGLECPAGQERERERERAFGQQTRDKRRNSRKAKQAAHQTAKYDGSVCVWRRDAEGGCFARVPRETRGALIVGTMPESCDVGSDVASVLRV